jgi:hypothetical protein
MAKAYLSDKGNTNRVFKLRCKIKLSCFLD